MVTFNHLCDDVELYALGGLSEEESKEFELHLVSCASCQIRLSELQEITDAMLYDFTDVKPPTGMRERVLTAAWNTPQLDQNSAPEEKAAIPSPSNIVPIKKSLQHKMMPFVSVAAILVISVLGWQNSTLLSKTQAQQNQISKLGQLVATAQMSPIGAFKGIDGQVLVLSSGDQKIVLVKAANLPKPTNLEKYNLWVKDDQGQLINGGTFTPTSSGQGMIVFPVTNDNFKAVIISLEPDAYSGDKPRGVPVMQGSVQL